MALSLDNPHGWTTNNSVAQNSTQAPAAPTTQQLEAREGPAPAQWQAVREEIRVLYEKKPLRDVRRILEQRHGFRATERMYKARLAQWGFSKNYSDKDYQICAVLHHARQKSGKRRTAFVIHGHKRSVKDLHKYIKGRKMSEDAFLATALKNIHIDSLAEHEQAQYAHVRAYTPPPGGPNTPKPDVDGDGDEQLPSPTQMQGTHTAGKYSSPRRKSASGSGSGSFSNHQGSHPLLQTKSSQSTTSLFPSPATQLTTSTRHMYGSQLSPSGNSVSVTWPSPSHPHLSTSPLDESFSSAALSYKSAQGIALGNYQDHSTHASSVQSSPCQQLGRDVEYMALQVTDGLPLRSLCGHDDIQAWRLLSETSSSDGGEYEHVCPGCYEPSRNHFVSLTNLELPQQSRNILNETIGGGDSTIFIPPSSRDHQHSWRWVARCFAACIYLSRGDDELSRRSLADANAEFKQMLVPTQDPKIVLALNQTLQILHMHDQGEITKKIMRSAYNVAQRVLGPEDPLTVITRWMVYVANLQMRDRDITSFTLYGVYGHYLRQHGPEDPRSIASLYCHGYMLNVERRLEPAEQVLRDVYTISCANLGPRHLQSLSALTNMARCLERQGKLDQAIEMMERVIKDSRDTLGESHPRRLESMRILGTFLEQRGDLGMAERLYWRVLEGRIKMLGVNHKFTLGAREGLEALLKRVGKWDAPGPQYVDGDGAENKGQNGQSEAQTRIQDLFEWNPYEISEDVAVSIDGDLSDGVGSEHDAF
ncbi:hypothetical protein LTR20_008664 [Exophiala xenobiotica]|nr:hypothetical protein LTS13_002389 [Exophiala xenobiotica]KAK5399484.1 hypothetical protein LTR79_003121 [Exophiala xenobiotica]KAK5416429.1 hypothetical protein LTR90_005650 [Exophiala xenobiotica]KAK5457917.1 hypothetical protein LTR20_008664 [Exophiala xenobiotica]KAK5490887.1 hypothetical protein LTR26_003648 [Exophiala xenobiotica]